MNDDIERRDADSRIWVLGAPDPEMAAIEGLLRECRETVVYAADARGERVTAGASYRGESLIADSGNHPCTDGTTDVYLVECELLTPDARFEPGEDICHPELAGRTVRRIDHHRPGDPGYGRQPSEFLEASSIGQVVAELSRVGRLPGSWDREVGPEGLGLGEFFFAPDGDPSAAPDWFVVSAVHAYGSDDGGEPDFDSTDLARIPHDLVLCAAADHCLGAAYRGECPAVDPDALMAWRAESRAKFQGRDVSDVLADVERARESLRRAPTVALDRVSPRRRREEGCPAEASRAFCVRDMRGVCTAHRLDDCGCGTQQCVTACGAYAHGPCSVPELPDAASRDGEAYVTTVTAAGSRPKIVLGGCTTPEMVRAFLDHWAPSQGLVDAYGDPQRGFAGAYLSRGAHGHENG